MKAQLIVLSAAALLLAAQPAAAATAVERYIADTHADATERLAQRQVDLAGQTLTIKVGVAADRLKKVSVVKSTGSRDLDDKALEALRNLRTEAAPAELLGRDVTLTLGAAAPHAAAVAAR